jgi:hypothetical protein
VPLDETERARLNSSAPSIVKPMWVRLAKEVIGMLSRRAGSAVFSDVGMSRIRKPSCSTWSPRHVHQQLRGRAAAQTHGRNSLDDPGSRLPRSPLPLVLLGSRFDFAHFSHTGRCHNIDSPAACQPGTRGEVNGWLRKVDYSLASILACTIRCCSSEQWVRTIPSVESKAPARDGEDQANACDSRSHPRGELRSR